MEHSPRARGGRHRVRLRFGASVLFALLAGTFAVSVSSASPLTGAAPLAAPSHSAHPAQANPFQTRGMWIWELPASNSGNLQSIINQARQYQIGTLYIKSGDGSGMWSQFNSTLVSTLHASGLRVCAWQYVYGTYPQREAQVGAQAVKDGADCLVIDAETEYEGKYYQAQTYINGLRQLIGSSFPLGLAGFPYVDYHPSFPYSVFLGPNGATYNLPQMYWQDIGTSVDQVYAHTFIYNRLYQRPVSPLGQIYNSPPVAQIKRFRQLLGVYAARGISWWDWQDAHTVQWRAISTWVPPLANVTAASSAPTLSNGSAGDLVVWAQEHLESAGETVSVNGAYGARTIAAVKTFQQQHSLSVDGIVGPQTWAALLSYQPAPMTWTPTSPHHGTRMVRPTAAALAAADTRAMTPAEPLSAVLPDRGHELPPSLGAGRP